MLIREMHIHKNAIIIKHSDDGSTIILRFDSMTPFLLFFIIIQEPYFPMGYETLFSCMHLIKNPNSQLKNSIKENLLTWREIMNITGNQGLIKDDGTLNE